MRTLLFLLCIVGVMVFAGCGDSDSPIMVYPSYVVIEYDLIYDEYVTLEVFTYEWEALELADSLNLDNLDMNIEYVVVEVASYSEWSDLEHGWFRLE